MKKMMRKNFLSLFMSASMLTYCFGDLQASDALSLKDEQQDQAGTIVRNTNNSLNKDVLTIVL